MLVLEAAGYDVMLVETIGTGQSETMVADMTDFFLVLMLPSARPVSCRGSRKAWSKLPT